MVALRHTPPVGGGFWQLIAFHHGHRAVMLGEHPRGQQTGHACAEDDGVGPDHGPLSRRALPDRGRLSVPVGTMVT